MKPRIYHNPKCSKSRATMALLASENIDLDVIEYLKTPPDAETITALLAKLGMPAGDLIRTGEDEFKAAGIDLESATEADLIGLMVKHPRLIERPIVEVDDSARIGRPPEQVLGLFK